MRISRATLLIGCLLSSCGITAPKEETKASSLESVSSSSPTSVSSDAAVILSTFLSGYPEGYSFSAETYSIQIKAKEKNKIYEFSQDYVNDGIDRYLVFSLNAMNSQENESTYSLSGSSFHYSFDFDVPLDFSSSYVINDVSNEILQGNGTCDKNEAKTNAVVDLGHLLKAVNQEFSALALGISMNDFGFIHYGA